MLNIAWKPWGRNDLRGKVATHHVLDVASLSERNQAIAVLLILENLKTAQSKPYNL